MSDCRTKSCNNPAIFAKNEAFFNVFDVRGNIARRGRRYASDLKYVNPFQLSPSSGDFGRPIVREIPLTPPSLDPNPLANHQNLRARRKDVSARR
jgi:hypothetical protein